MIKVSIIVPVYNKENEIRVCLDSLVNQTLKEIEIIVINDGSIDKSIDIIKEYQKKYKNIILINQKNHGIGYSRNKGLEASRGEYIGFVDGDDYVSLDMYEKYYSYAKRNKADVVTSNYFKVNSKVQVFNNDYFSITNITNNKNIVNLIDYGAWNKIFKASILKEKNILFEEKLKYEDMTFTAKAIASANKIGHLNKPYYYYRIHDNSETTTIDKRVFDILEIMKKTNNIYECIGSSQELEYLNITKITTYMLMQKHQIDKSVKKEFINECYIFLNSMYPNWKKNKYYLKTNIFKRLIKNNKILLKIYCKG